MASDDKKAKPATAPKIETPAKKKTEDSAKKDSTSGEATPTSTPKTESKETTSDSAAKYSRGEGQKPVSKAYKDNWNLIFGKKKKR
jgi:hypothetical protein